MPKTIRYALAVAIAALLIACRPSPKADVQTHRGAPRLAAAARVPPYAQLLVSRNGGVPSAGPQNLSVSSGDVLTFMAGSSVGVSQWLWEIIDYPPGMALPTGWNWEGVPYASPMMYNGGYAPPSVTVPSQGTQTWGKIEPRLTVNGNPIQYLPSGAINTGFNPNLTDSATLLYLASVGGLEGLAFQESNQGDVYRAWEGTIQRNFRAIDTAISAGANAQIYGGIYTATAATASIPTANTAVALAPTSTLSAAKNISTSNGVIVATASVVLVNASISLHTGSTATTTTVQIYKNGAALTDTARNVATGSSSAYVDVAISTVVSAAVSDSFKLYAQTTGTSVTLTYLASLVVTNAGASQGLPGPQGPGGGIVPTGAALTGSVNALATGNVGKPVDTTSGSVTAQLLNGVIDGEAKTFTIIAGSHDFILTTVGGSGNANIVSASNGGVAANAVVITGVSSSITLTWIAAANSGLGEWFTQ